MGIDNIGPGFNPHLLSDQSPVNAAISALVLPSAFRPVPDQGSPTGSRWEIDQSLLVSAEVTNQSPFTVTYRIRPEASWTDNAPIVADDFWYLWRQMVGQPGVVDPAGYDLITGVQSIDGGKTAVVTFAQPYPAWRELFSDIVPAHIVKDIPGGFGAGLARAMPVTGGQFRVESIDPQRDEILLARNDRFWGQPAAPDQILFRRAGTPSALSGSTKPRSDGYIGQFDASIAWVIEVIAELGLDDPANLADLRALARPDWIKAAAQSVARAYDADGELVDDGAPARLSLRSLQTYLQRLGTIFEALGCNVAKATIARLLEDPKLKGLDGMTAENIAFCRSLVRSPSLQTVLFDLPWTLQATAQALLERWETLSLGERHAAIRMGACAVAMLLLTRCAPIRVKNLAGITYKGPKRWLSAPTKGGLALLLIPASETKNGKEIRAHLQNAGRKTSWSLVSWYLEHVRPRMAEVGSASRAAIDGPALFPGTAGTITRSTLRDWIKVETAACGLPMRPHQARHAIASILLNRNWNDIRKIAALLGDTVSTVERNYAWMDAEKLMADAQAMIPTAASLLKGTRRG